MKHRLPAEIPYDLTVGTAVPTGASSYGGENTIYDQASATGATASGTLQAGATTYDALGATGSIGGATVIAGETTYDQAGATGSTSGATVLPPETQR